MSPASYRTAPPRGDVLTLWGPGGLTQISARLRARAAARARGWRRARAGGRCGGRCRGGLLAGGLLGGGELLQGLLEGLLGLAVGDPVALLQGGLAVGEGLLCRGD